MEQRPRLLAAVSWNFAGRIADAAGLYMVNLLSARILGVAEYGGFALLLGGLQLATALGSFGLDATLNRYIPLYAGSGQESSLRFLIRRVLLVRILLLLAAPLAVFFAAGLPGVFRAHTSGLAVFVALSFGRSLAPLLTMGMVGQLKTRIPAVITVCVRCAEIALVCALGKAGTSVFDLSLLLGATSLSHVLLLAVFFTPRLVGAESAIPMKPILAFAGVFAVNVVVDFVLGRYGDVVLLANLATRTEQTGLYEVGASMVYAAGLVMTTGFSGVFLALFSGQLAAPYGGLKRLRSMYHSIVRLISFLTIPVFVFLAVAAPAIISLLFGREYLEAAFVVRSLVAYRVAARLFGGGENTDALLAMGCVGTVTMLGVLAGTINLVGDLVLIPSHGMAGAVIAAGSAQVIITGGTFLALKNRCTVVLQHGFYLRLLAACAGGGAVVLLLPADPGPILLCAECLLYPGIVCTIAALLKPFSPNDVSMISKIAPRWVPILKPFVKKEWASRIVSGEE